MFPFDLTVLLEEVRPWHDCDLMLSAYQVEVEVVCVGNWYLNVVRYQRSSDEVWVRPASGSELEDAMRRGALGQDGWDKIDAAVASEIAERRNGGMRRLAA